MNPSDLPLNHFKRRLQEGQAQIGLWLALANSYSAELCAGAGFDWLLLDSEHAPNDVRTLLAQLQAIAPYDVAPIVRPAAGDAVLIKQLLDIGAQTLLVPNVETAEQAASLVLAMRYPPDGIRGVGSGLARASRWNRVTNYLGLADNQMCLLTQVESLKGLAQLDAIARVDGVDGVFIGPSDLSAAMGHRGNPGHPEVQRVIEDAIARIRAAGKAAGILIADETLAKRYLELGCTFVGVGTDIALLSKGAQALAQRFKSELPTEALAKTAGPSVY
jgi:4-hydroxy-2-oxoheptanedioate aldolase